MYGASGAWYYSRRKGKKHKINCRKMCVGRRAEKETRVFRGRIRNAKKGRREAKSHAMAPAYNART